MTVTGEQVQATCRLIADSIADARAPDVAANTACVEDVPPVSHNGPRSRCALREACGSEIGVGTVFISGMRFQGTILLIS